MTQIEKTIGRATFHAILAIVRLANYNGGMSKANANAAPNWRYAANLWGVAVSMGLVGGCIARSDANIVIVAISGFAAGALMFVATVVVERIHPHC